MIMIFVVCFFRWRFLLKKRDFEAFSLSSWGEPVCHRAIDCFRDQDGGGAWPRTLGLFLRDHRFSSVWGEGFGMHPLGS